MKKSVLIPGGCRGIESYICNACSKYNFNVVINCNSLVIKLNEYKRTGRVGKPVELTLVV
ncbi:MAG: hypothetical protein GXO97_01585 [Nitrospirae bacterium]|nr:hypothetical protein [Nitrospirota bacterium]